MVTVVKTISLMGSHLIREGDQVKFGNTSLYRRRKIIEGRFFLAIMEIAKLSDGHDYKKAVLQFRDVLRLSEPDHGRLPVTGKMSAKPEILSCVLHLLCEFVLAYWASESCRDLDVSVEPCLEKLELLATSGFDEFQVLGDFENKYCLIKKFV